MKKQRIAALTTALCLALSLAALPASAADDSTRTETIRALGIMAGDSSGDLGLNRAVSRAEFVTMMTAAASYKDTVGSGYGVSLFKDVKSSHWASEYIRLAAEQNWMTGYTDGTFRPDDTITYEQMTTILSSVAVWASMSAEELNGKTDISLADYQDFSPWAQRPAWIMDQLGALVGGLQPQDLATRETAAGMLYAMMDSLHILWQ